MATGVLHLLAGLILDLNPAQFDREAAFWWTEFGVMLLILGGLVHWARTGTLPAFRPPAATAYRLDVEDTVGSPRRPPLLSMVVGLPRADEEHRAGPL